MRIVRPQSSWPHCKSSLLHLFFSLIILCGKSFLSILLQQKSAEKDTPPSEEGYKALCMTTEARIWGTLGQIAASVKDLTSQVATSFIFQTSSKPDYRISKHKSSKRIETDKYPRDIMSSHQFFQTIGSTETSSDNPALNAETFESVSHFCSFVCFRFSEATLVSGHVKHLQWCSL